MSIHGISRILNNEWKEKSSKAAIMERRGMYEKASLMWLEAAELAYLSFDIRWCRARAARCKHLMNT